MTRTKAIELLFQWPADKELVEKFYAEENVEEWIVTTAATWVMARKVETDSNATDWQEVDYVRRQIHRR